MLSADEADNDEVEKDSKLSPSFSVENVQQFSNEIKNFDHTKNQNGGINFETKNDKMFQKDSVTNNCNSRNNKRFIGTKSLYQAQRSKSKSSSEPIKPNVSIVIDKNIEEWSVEDVADWLEANSFGEYVQLFCDQHRIDGQVLINLTVEDLKSEPLKLSILGDIKRFCLAFDHLRSLQEKHTNQKQYNLFANNPLSSTTNTVSTVLASNRQNFQTTKTFASSSLPPQRHTNFQSIPKQSNIGNNPRAVKNDQFIKQNYQDNDNGESDCSFSSDIVENFNEHRNSSKNFNQSLLEKNSDRSKSNSSSSISSFSSTDSIYSQNDCLESDRSMSDDDEHPLIDPKNFDNNKLSGQRMHRIQARIVPKMTSGQDLAQLIHDNYSYRISDNSRFSKSSSKILSTKDRQQTKVIKHGAKIPQMKLISNYEVYNGNSNGNVDRSHNSNNRNKNLYRQKSRYHHHHHHHRKNEFKPEAWKAIVALVYFFSATWITAIVMVIVHDRVPDMATYPPLPDIILDNLPLIPWAFSMAETCGVILFTMWSIILIFHKHRFILLRRMFSLFGSVFLIRCFTMVITSLSVPGKHLECKARPYGTWSERIHQAYLIWQGGGMAIKGVRTCGDYMFSGHTVVLTMLNFFITEYTPTGLYLIHTMSWVLNLFGVFFILAAHEHYSIDVFIAFYISTRLFLYYHTLANNRALYQSDRHRTRIWFPLFSFFESGVSGIVPNEYEMPFRKTKDRLLNHLAEKIVRIQLIRMLFDSEYLFDQESDQRNTFQSNQDTKQLMNSNHIAMINSISSSIVTSTSTTAADYSNSTSKLKVQ